MVTRRSTHANHARSGGAAKRSAQRRGSSAGGALYAGGKKDARGGHVGNVGGFGGGPGLGSNSTRAAVKRKTRGGTQQKAGSAVAGGGAGGVHKRGGGSSGADQGVRVPTPTGGEILLTRRHFLFGALGVGALAAAGGGASVLLKKREEEAASDITVLEVPEANVTTLAVDDEESPFTKLDDTAERVELAGRYELPYGTLLWATGDDVAACLLPNDTAKPLVHVGILSLGSGDLTTVLEQAVGQDDGFDVYDARATASGLVWTEANILEGIWRVYAARLSGGTLGEPQLLDEGDSDWETPTIAAAGSHAFWQVLPKVNGPYSTEDSLVKRAAFGAAEAEVAYTSHGRLCTPPYALANGVVITPRADTSGTYYQLTLLDADSGEVRDTMVLPRAMRPLEAGYGDTGFTFSFDAWYQYGDGISHIGTYTPLEGVSDGNYSGAPWFCYSRTPSAAPAWCGGAFMVKSTRTVNGIDLATKQYFLIEPENGADDYGEYLASTGSNNVVVTYANIDDKPLNGEPKKYCLVRVWRPLA
ncbi:MULTISPECIES: Tat pathway signal protein [Gordonibacter]|uniref:Tat pathway signal protein n=1 Tax=Gordonibacter faecis TaxID=3047475 RepID=A0ABT7DKP9_9ACTN|nr:MULTISPECIES: Tat pathway signal protein [unclassified Gordonibacter]MDJ1650109.1 Tat pathway signal protein [Gordonibacter sp. KGMB12511]